MARHFTLLGKRRAQAEGDEPEDDENTPEAAAEDGAGPEDDDTGNPEAADGEDDEDEGGGEMSAEQVRVNAILEAPAAKGREDLAKHLALKTQMPAKDAIAALKAAPVAKGDRLDRAMAAQTAPSLGRGGGAGGGADSPRAGLHAAVQRQISKIKPAA